MVKDKIEKTKEKKVTKKEVKNDLKVTYQAIGRRRESTARVKLLLGSDGEILIKGKEIKKGDILINLRPVEQYFPGEINKKKYTEPFRTTNTVGRYAVSALITGGGLVGQLEAFVHGVSRALLLADKEKFRPILKAKGFLTRDDRTKQRHKAGFAQKARAKKQSPKR